MGMFFFYIVLRNFMNLKRNTFDSVLLFFGAMRTLDKGRGLDFGSYSRMLRIPKYSAWT